MIYTKGPKTPSFIEVEQFRGPVRNRRHSMPIGLAPDLTSLYPHP
jgi:hypothetical protein